MTLVACRDNNNAGTDTAAPTGTAADSADGGFCEAMSHLIVLLSPTEDSGPSDTEATFTEAAGWFEQANSTAPAAIASDVAAFKNAYDEYASYLGTVGFNLDTVLLARLARSRAPTRVRRLPPRPVPTVTGPPLTGAEGAGPNSSREGEQTHLALVALASNVLRRRTKRSGSTRWRR